MSHHDTPNARRRFLAQSARIALGSAAAYATLGRLQMVQAATPSAPEDFRAMVCIYLFGIQDILEDVGPLGKFSVLLLLLMGNVVFFVYDIALSRIITAYRMVLRKKIFKRVGQG